MSPKANSASVISSILSASNDSLAALIAPPSQVMSSNRSFFLSLKVWLADPLVSIGNVTYFTTTGLPPASSTSIPASLMRIGVSPAVTPKFTVFQPKPNTAIGGNSGNDREN